MSGTDFMEPINKTVVESHDDFLLSLKKLLNLDFCEYSITYGMNSRGLLTHSHNLIISIVTNCSKEEKFSPFTTYESLREGFIEIGNIRNASLDSVEQEKKAQQEFSKSW
jgi:hypothetical protein